VILQKTCLRPYAATILADAYLRAADILGLGVASVLLLTGDHQTVGCHLSWSCAACRLRCLQGAAGRVCVCAHGVQVKQLPVPQM
jgi:hypothetical protein